MFMSNGPDPARLAQVINNLAAQYGSLDVEAPDAHGSVTLVTGDGRLFRLSAQGRLIAAGRKTTR